LSLFREFYNTLIEDGDGELPLGLDAAQGEFAAERRFVDAFQEAGAAEMLVHFPQQRR